MRGPVLFITGELSADLYAARIITELKTELPALTVRGLGGRQMAAAGAELLFPLADEAVMGLGEAAGSLGRLREAMRIVRQELRDRPPAVVICIDYGGFNLQVARAAKRLSPATKVVYYIPPKVWAWGGWRTRRLRRDVDLVLSTFPFETEYLQVRGVAVEYCGHPLPELLRECPADHDFRSRYRVAPDREGLLLLPGSRSQEYQRLLPVFLAAARRFQKERDCEVWLAPAPGVDQAWLTAMLRRQPLPVKVVTERYAAMRCARAALAASGTVTLELALLQVPTVVAYRLAPLTWLAAKLLVRVDYAALPNLLLDRAVLPELLQDECRDDRLAAALLSLWDDPVNREKREELTAVEKALGPGGGLSRAAAAITRIYKEVA